MKLEIDVEKILNGAIVHVLTVSVGTVIVIIFGLIVQLFIPQLMQILLQEYKLSGILLLSIILASYFILPSLLVFFKRSIYKPFFDKKISPGETETIDGTFKITLHDISEEEDSPAVFDIFDLSDKLIDKYLMYAEDKKTIYIRTSTGTLIYSIELGATARTKNPKTSWAHFKIKRLN